MVFRTRATLLGILVGGLFMAQPALAIPFTVTAWAPAGHAAVNISKTDPTAKNYNGQGGGFVMTNTLTAESFVSWCVDIFQVIPGSTPGAYSVDVGGLATLSSTTRDDLGRLATLFLTQATTAGANNNSAAFQLAVWEIFYEHTTSTPTYDLGSGTFRSNSASSAPHTTAQGWLTQLNNNPNSANNYSIDVFTSANNQDQITFRNVSEPATLGLLGLGLIGLGWVQRKSRRGQATMV